MGKFCLSDKKGDGGGHYDEVDVKEFIKKRLYGATKLLSLFNKGILNSNDLREHRWGIKDDAGEGLI